MPTYAIRTPAGYSVAVSGVKTQEEALKIAREKWETLPRVLKQAGSGIVVEMDGGTKVFVAPGYSSTNPEEIDKIMNEGIDPGQAARERADATTVGQNPIAARGTAIVRGVPFVGSGLDEVAGMVGGPEAKANLEGLGKAFERNNPVEAAGLNLAGTAATLAGVGGAIPKALSPVGSMITGRLPWLKGLAGVAAGSAAEGGSYGALDAAEGERGVGATVGATVGGLTGAGVGAAAPFVAKGAQAIFERFARSDVNTIARTLGISRDAAKVIRNTIDQGGDPTSAMRNMRAAGDDAMLIDASEATQALGDATAASGNVAAKAMRDPIEKRAKDVNRRFANVRTQTLGPAGRGPKIDVEEIALSTAPQRRAAYDYTYEQPVDYAGETGRKIEDVIARTPRSTLRRAIEEANEAMMVERRVNSQIMASIDDATGEVTFSQPMNTLQLDYLKRALQGIQREEVVDFRPTGKGVRAGSLAGDLRDALSGVEGYDEAMAIGGDAIAEREAYLIGERLADPKTTVEDVMLTLNGGNRTPSMASLMAAQRGLSTRLGKVLGDVQKIPSDPNLDARELLTTVRLFSSANSIQKLRQILPREQLVPFLRELAAAEQTLKVRAALATNSKTQIRQATQKSVDEITAPGIVGTALAGEPLNTTKRLIQFVTGQTAEYTADRKQAIYLDIAKALTEKKGETAREAYRVIRRAIENGNATMTPAERSLVANALAGGATVGTAATINREWQGNLRD